MFISGVRCSKCGIVIELILPDIGSEAITENFICSKCKGAEDLCQKHKETP